MSLPTTTDGWVVEPKEAPAALSEDFRPEPFTPEQVAAEYTAASEQRPEEPEPTSLHAGRDWVSLAEKLDAGGMALLMKYAAIGDPNGSAHAG
jgi:hypothetical protein